RQPGPPPRRSVLARASATAHPWAGRSRHSPSGEQDGPAPGRLLPSGWSLSRRPTTSAWRRRRAGSAPRCWRRQRPRPPTTSGPPRAPPPAPAADLPTPTVVGHAAAAFAGRARRAVPLAVGPALAGGWERESDGPPPGRAEGVVAEAGAAGPRALPDDRESWFE